MNAQQQQQDVCIRLGPGRRVQCALREGRRPARSPWSPGPGGRGAGWGEEAGAGFPGGAPTEAASCGPAGTVLGTRVPAEQRAAASRRDAAPLPFQRPWGVWWEPAPASLGLGETLKMTSGSFVCKDLGTRYHGRH